MSNGDISVGGGQRPPATTPTGSAGAPTGAEIAADIQARIDNVLRREAKSPGSSVDTDGPLPTGPLLPDPMQSMLGGADLMALMMELSSKRSDTNAAAAEGRIKDRQAVKDTDNEKKVDDAKKTAHKSNAGKIAGIVLGWIGIAVAAVIAAVVTVVSGGVAGAVMFAMVGVAAGLMIAQQTGAINKAMDKMGLEGKDRMAFSLGLSALVIVITVVATLGVGAAGAAAEGGGMAVSETAEIATEAGTMATEAAADAAEAGADAAEAGADAAEAGAEGANAATETTEEVTEQTVQQATEKAAEEAAEQATEEVAETAEKATEEATTKATEEAVTETTEETTEATTEATTKATTKATEETTEDVEEGAEELADAGEKAAKKASKLRLTAERIRTGMRYLGAMDQTAAAANTVDSSVKGYKASMTQAEMKRLSADLEKMESMDEEDLARIKRMLEAGEQVQHAVVEGIADNQRVASGVSKSFV
ncbi:MAG: type III secretion system translocon subunit SctE [Gammaproteobacteria bacterium]